MEEQSQPTYRHHSEPAREILRKASLSMESELSEDEAARLQEAVELYSGNLDQVTGWSLRHYIIPPSAAPVDEAAAINDKGESTMAKTKTRGRPRRPELTKAQVAKLAKMRRDGATWAEVSSEAGQVRSSTGWAECFAEHGFDKFGRKIGSNQTSKARAWGSSSNSKGSKKTTTKKRKVVKRRKATAKK